MRMPSVLLASAIAFGATSTTLAEMPVWSGYGSLRPNTTTTTLSPSETPPAIPPISPPKEPEPSWSGSVFAQGAELEWIESTPIHLRPYRPFHVYGNTVRRLHYRGNPLPTFRDLQDGTLALLGLPAN